MCAPTCCGKKFSDRTKGMIDSIAFILFFLPTMAVLFFISIDDFFYSMSINERSNSGASGSRSSGRCAP